jgi:hypothetical protein
MAALLKAMSLEPTEPRWNMLNPIKKMEKSMPVARQPTTQYLMNVQ